MLTRDLKVGAMKRTTTLPETLKALSGGEFNLLIADWSRQTDSIKLLQALRGEKSFNRYMPVVVVTSNTGAKQMQTLRDAGVDEVLSKPFTERILRSRLLAVAKPTRPYVESAKYFGPDRRRFRREFEGENRRHHANSNNPDRRLTAFNRIEEERRQGYPGFRPLDRRGSNVRTKIKELITICEGLGVPQVLALRRITLCDPNFAEPSKAADLSDFFTIQLLARIEDYSYEKLEEMAPNGFAPLLPPGTEIDKAEDRAIIENLTHHLFG
jgi:CheY-like chemotaxis protein